MLDRRSFLALGLGVLPGIRALAAPRGAGEDRVLVVLELAGGHDALSALVPRGRREYADARRATRIAERELLPVDEECGLHPALKGIHGLLREGAFAALPGVGYPVPIAGHREAAEAWHVGDPRGREAREHGWLGRACDALGRGAGPESDRGVVLGTGGPSPALDGEAHRGFVVRDPEALAFAGDRGDPRLAAAWRDLNRDASDPFDPPALRWAAAAAEAALAAGAGIREAVRSYRSRVDYPGSALGRNLRIVAALIHRGPPSRIFHVVHSGYDTHEDQRARHDRLMAELDAALCAFQGDLFAQGHARRVLTLTTSEFGRALPENGTRGTEHGSASTLFLFGPAVKPGVRGPHPVLSDLHPGGGLRSRVDVRSVYATVAERWLGISPERVLGRSHPILDLLA